ncbi:Amino acid transporter, transmembrane [Corchorus olitorius]|uniref:Amino acid transporter, transmembrane n=1 Tax=Corchorus olitorius TaxID=93759 RepID=A0A1R3KEX5_9ROSI|nr:Amino acid transporter, transmembrane [Corchorus olitorius]
MADLVSDQDKQISFLKTCINGMNALSGIGILSVPYALSSGGWLSLVILLLIAAAACFTALLISRCMDANPESRSYIDIAGQAFGRKGRVIASVFICLELFFVATGLLIMEGDNLTKLSPGFALKLGSMTLEGKLAFVIFSGLAILPSMWLNDLSALSYVSAGGVLCSLVILVCVFCVGVTKEVGFHGKGRLINLNGIPTAINLYTFCYGAHAVFPPIYSSMRKKSQFSKVLLTSFIICTITYMSMAILGYLIYGQNVQSQVTLNLPTEKVSSKIAIFTVLAAPIAKYALTVMPIATAIASRLPANYRGRKAINIVIRMSILISTVVLAVVFPSFQSVMSLCGAVLVVCVSFLFPCLCYLKTFEIYKKWGIELVGIVIIMLLALGVGSVGTYSSIAQTVKQI